MKCKDCGTEMNFIDEWETEFWDYSLYQCPKCKTVVIDRSKSIVD